MKTLLLIFILSIAFKTNAQQVESIDFHLYTDSLKKGRYNYINIDGKLSNGHYLPLTQKEVIFKSNTGKWDGNSLIIDSSYNKDSVVITAILKNNTSLTKTITIYIKKSSYEGKMYTEKEVMDNKRKKKN